MTSPTLISLQEGAATLGVSPFTLRRLAARGEVKLINIGGRRLISTAECARIAREGAGRPRPRKRGDCQS
ncbi:MAG TPA: hypothetical protein VNK82_05915 [Terriglobales bacterium]|nr:hypothetical protein [Terriglobales bacterium]